jgi:hypothetical protein
MTSQLLLLLLLHYYYSIGAAKRDAEELLKTLLSDTTNDLNSTTKAMSTDAIETAFDGVSIAVKGLFEERVESITKAYEGAATIADSTLAELTALLFIRLDSVQSKHALLREKLDSAVAAAQDDSVVEFLVGVDAIELPLPSSELDAKLKTLLDTTTAKLSKTVLALVSSVTQQQELPSFKSAASAQAFAKLDVVTHAIVQHRAANGTHAELKVQQEAKAAADVAATQAQAAAAKAIADAAQAEQDAAEQLADYKRSMAQRQQQQDEEREKERTQAAALQRAQQQQRRQIEEQQQQWQQQQPQYSQRYGDEPSTGGCSAHDDCCGSEGYGSTSSASGPLNKDGTPNMKYKVNWNTNSQGQYINKNGDLKMSIGSNRAYAAQQSSYGGSSCGSDGGSGSSASGPLKKDGTPDRRYKANR